MNISCKIGSGTFNYRVAGVLIHDNKVLLCTEECVEYWFLPGGRVAMFEPSTQALQREIIEELGEKPTIERLLWTTENMFYLSLWGSKVHELCLYYLISLPKYSEIYQQESFVMNEVDEDKVKILTFRWFDIATLEDVHIKPNFVKTSMRALPLAPEHLMVIDS